MRFRTFYVSQVRPTYSEYQEQHAYSLFNSMLNTLPLSTLAANSAIVDALDRSGGSIVLVSCKGDSSPQLRRVDPDFNEQITSRFSKVETCSTSANVPESQKRCISIILRSILRGRRGKHYLASLNDSIQSYLYCLSCYAGKRKHHG